MAPTLDQPTFAEAAGQQIGRYKLLQQIGEGGFGVVYMAEQARPIRRKVALKLIKPGMDSKAVVSRFEAERQALAMMDHENNIARVLDGGATDSGRPYFVMELVKGVPITEYCDQNHLPTDDRLKLFITVCQAVQHAHQKGIIHRDIKPSNVLVTLHDGKPVVKVIDFGVAKAINQQLTEKTLFTTYGQMIGTPQYMSPEQAEMSGLDVDTRSDIYSLGVLLYELLTGTTPLESDRLRTAGYAEMQRLIREVEPPKPSTRLSTSGEKLTVIAKHRGITPDRLQRIIRGDLDWIVMKALDKDRSRRYDSANDLSADVGRYLSDEVIQARPPTVRYRTLKFLSRYRALVSVVGVIMLALLGGACAAGYGILVATRESKNAVLARDQAEMRRKEEERLNNELSTSLAELREELLDRAINDALAGDIPAAASALKRRDQGTVPTATTLLIEALALVNQGKADEAVERLDAIAGHEVESRLTHAVQGLVMFNGRQLEKLEDHWGVDSNQVKSNADSIQDLENLVVAQIESSNAPANPERLLQSIKEIIVRHPRWGIAHAVRAQILLGRAKRFPDISTLEEARRAARSAVGHSPDCPVAVMVGLRVTAAMIELLNETPNNNPDTVRRLKSEAEELATGLDQWPNFTLGRMFRCEYYRVTDQKEKMQSEIQALADGGSFAQQIQVAQALLDTDSVRIEVLKRENPFYATEAGAATRKVFDGHIDYALDDFEYLWKSNSSLLLRTIFMEIPLLAQRPELAKEKAREAINGWEGLFPEPHWSEVCVMKYFAEDITEAQLRKQFGPFQVEQSVLDWAIGIKKLSTAQSAEDVLEARNHLAEAAGCVLVGWWHREFSKSYVELIDRGLLPLPAKDPN